MSIIDHFLLVLYPDLTPYTVSHAVQTSCPGTPRNDDSWQDGPAIIPWGPKNEVGKEGNNGISFMSGRKWLRIRGYLINSVRKCQNRPFFDLTFLRIYPIISTSSTSSSS